jgi:two-component system sensor histidine kinase KdpD
MARGKLRIYLGAAPGVGKTYAMLDEGWRRHARGTDIVVGLVVHHDRPKTIAQIRDLEVIPEKEIEYRGRPWKEMDTDAILARKPQVALVDELAHTNVPGSKREKRWQDIEVLLDAGIDVISTVNIQHLESLNDVVNQITGIVQRETVPDSVVRRADQIELVDMSPEALRRRMAHGNIYAPEKVDAALGNYFRVGNLAALRELALLWVADRVEDSLQAYMADHGITGTWETRERVVVALTGAPAGEQLIRRAARMARRAKGDLLGVHIRNDDGLASAPSELLGRHRTLLEELGGTYHQVAGSDIPAALVGFAKAQHATQLVLGTSHRSRWTEITRGSVINTALRQANEIDVHVISTGAAPSSRQLVVPRFRVPSAQTRPRILGGLLTAAVLLPALTALLVHNRGSISTGDALLVFLGLVVLSAVIGGLIPALATVVVATVLVDWYLIAPYGSLTVAHGSNALYLLTFVVSGAVVSAVVEQTARRRKEATRARYEADALLRLAAHLASPNPPQAVVEQIEAALCRDSVTLLAHVGGDWIVEASAGVPVAAGPDDGERYDLRTGRALVILGPALPAEDHRLVAAFVAYLEAAVAIHILQSQASTAAQLSAANDLRTALLAAVSHDLRTPLASIKASATSLLEPDVHWSREAELEFLRTIDLEADRLNKLVDNLLDMSRLQTGSLRLSKRPVGLDEIVPAALASLSRRADNVVIDVPETLCRVDADPALLERAIANIIENAVAHSPPDRTVRVEAAEVAGRVDLRVVDRGSGIPVSQRDLVFQPFQRLGDTDSGSGVGLGLAVARGFLVAMGGELTLEDTPGGGITMVLSLPPASDGPTEESRPTGNTSAMVEAAAPAAPGGGEPASAQAAAPAPQP